MRYAILALAATLACWGALAAPAPAAAGYACSAEQAYKDYSAARTARIRAERRESEARYVLSKTRYYSSVYGSPVGRWVRLARRVGWPRYEIPVLMRVMYGESRGYPTATNGQYKGLMQHGSYWYADYWSFDPYNPQQSLLYALKLKNLSGWEQWSVY